MSVTTIDRTAVLDLIVRDTLLTGGYSVNVFTNHRPTTGYMVSLPGSEVTVPVEEFSPESIQAYISAHNDELSQDDRYLGTWIRDGLVYLDVSINAHAVDDALFLGGLHNQMAIYDIQHDLEIQVP